MNTALQIVRRGVLWNGMKIRSTTDHMIACLRERDDKLCTDAADTILEQRALIQKLERRIHNQRASCRINWEIVEMREQYKRAWRPSKLLRSILMNRLNHKRS